MEKSQHMASIFWKSWKVEYLNALKQRRKWISPQRNVCASDVVLIRDKQLAYGTGESNNTE